MEVIAMLTRRTFLAAAVAGTTTAWWPKGAMASLADVAEIPGKGPGDLELSVRPTRVFKRTSDQNRLRMEYWLFNLFLRSPSQDKPVPASLVVDCLARGHVVRTTTWTAQAVAKSNLLAAAPMSAKEGGWLVAAFNIGDQVPAALAVDGVHCVLELDGVLGRRRLEASVRFETFAQKTNLVFPFVGNGMITQGGAWNDGHRNRSGMFAIDAIGLTDLYAAMTADGDASSSVAGWGRTIIAPAAGTVVVARGDRPDQPVLGVSDPAYFVPEYPNGGDPGNNVVIDHGNGEFSAIDHLQRGSVRVSVGDRVSQGQALGLLGSSGDSSSPHVHHQLQDGPDWTDANALPHAYANGPRGQHDRGAIFSAK
jgi:hypothetical protein